MIAAEKSRTVRLSHDPLALVIRETVRDVVKVETYYLAPVAGGWRLTKSEGTQYVVCLDGTKPACTCPGHRHYGHKPGFACRHVGALRAISARGNLANPE
jgi:hypothetical protein